MGTSRPEIQTRIVRLLRSVILIDEVRIQTPREDAAAIARLYHVRELILGQVARWEGREE
jgi:hypothetical protein